MKHDPTAGTKYCYNDDSTNCDSHGALYDNISAATVCQQLGAGWGLPTETQWSDIMGLGGTGGAGNNMFGIISSYPGMWYSSYSNQDVMMGAWTANPNNALFGLSYDANYKFTQGQ